MAMDNFQKELDELEAEVRATGGLAPAAITKIGVCKGQTQSRKGVVYNCGRYGTVFLPSQLCSRCCFKAIQELKNDGE